MRLTLLMLAISLSPGCATQENRAPVESALESHNRAFPGTSQSIPKTTRLDPTPAEVQFAMSESSGVAGAHSGSPSTAQVFRPSLIFVIDEAGDRELVSCGVVDAESVFGGMVRKDYRIEWKWRLGRWDLAKVSVGSDDYNYRHGVLVN